MSLTKSGMSSTSGFFACGPITSLVPTATSSISGCFAICAVMIWMSFQSGRSLRGTPMATISP